MCKLRRYDVLSFFSFSLIHVVLRFKNVELYSWSETRRSMLHLQNYAFTGHKYNRRNSFLDAGQLTESDTSCLSKNTETDMEVYQHE